MNMIHITWFNTYPINYPDHKGNPEKEMSGNKYYKTTKVETCLQSINTFSRNNMDNKSPNSSVTGKKICFVTQEEKNKQTKQDLLNSNSQEKAKDSLPTQQVLQTKNCRRKKIYNLFWHHKSYSSCAQKVTTYYVYLVSVVKKNFCHFL